MAYYTITLKANQPVRQQTAGRVILIDDTGAASGVDVQLMYNDREMTVMPDRKKGFKYVQEFDSIWFTASVDCVIAVFLSMNDVSLGFEGSAINVSGTVDVGNDPSAPVPVVAQQLTNVINYAAVAAGLAQVQLIHDATLKRLRFRNAHSTAIVAVGATGVTLADSPIRLGPGDVWVEDDAAGADWYAISDTAGANVQIQGVK